MFYIRTEGPRNLDIVWSLNQKTLSQSSDKNLDSEHLDRRTKIHSEGRTHWCQISRCQPSDAGEISVTVKHQEIEVTRTAKLLLGMIKLLCNDVIKYDQYMYIKFSMFNWYFIQRHGQKSLQLPLSRLI